VWLRYAGENAFRFAFQHTKASDCVIVGINPRFRDAIVQNADLTRRFGKLPVAEYGKREAQ